MNDKLSALVKPIGSLDASKDAPEERKVASRDWRTLFAKSLPWLMLVGFLILLASIFGERLIPARELNITSVVTVRQSAEDAQQAMPDQSKEIVDPYQSSMLFQASGWVEPDPYPVMATALVDGVVERVNVLEGDKVEEGEILATLIDEDAELDLETAKSRLASLEAQANSHHWHTDVIEAKIESLRKEVAAAEARKSESADLARRMENITSGSVSEREIARARLELATREAEVEALAVTESEMVAELQRVGEMVADFDAKVREAETDVARKKLALDRTRIPSPIEGRVLRLLAAPGQKKMLGMDDRDSATIALLYDPDHLQARIDVPLAEAAQLAVGQPVRLRSELLPDKTFRGRVTRIVGEADLQRNTLQAKVSIENPDDRLRPDMLCRAEFLPLPKAASEGKGQVSRTGGVETRVRIFVPNNAIQKEAGRMATVWKVSPSGDRIEPVQISLGVETRDDHRLVVEGMKPGDRVVLDPPEDLTSGERFRPAGNQIDSDK